MILRQFTVAFLFLWSLTIYAPAFASAPADRQDNRVIDSLKNVIREVKNLKTFKGDSTKIQALLAWDNLIYISDPDLDFKLNERIWQVCNINLRKNQSDAQKTFFQEKLSTVYNNLGEIYRLKSDYPMALDHYLNSLKLKEELLAAVQPSGDQKKIDQIKVGMAAAYNNIGLIHSTQSSTALALEYYLKSLAIHQELGNDEHISSCYNNIGIIYHEEGSMEKALDFYEKAMRIGEKIGDKRGVAITYITIGNLYTELFELDSVAAWLGEWASDKAQLLDTALVYNEKALVINKETNDGYHLSYSLSAIAFVHFKKKEYIKAAKYFHRSAELADSLGALMEVSQSNEWLSKTYEQLGKFKQSLKHYKIYSEIKDSVFNERSSGKMAEMQTKYETDKKEKEIVLLTKDNEIKDLAVSRQTLLRNSFIVGLVLALALAFLLYNRNRIRQKANALLREKNNQIVASINYASRIQTAILPPEELIKEHLPDSFILFQPKDVVSGDFYWFAHKNDKIFLVAADCTGHGVPGAFMSMIGNTLLNETIHEKEITDPSEILHQVSTGIIKTLRQRSHTGSMDGMDMALCVLDGNTLKFAGAQRPLFHVSKGKLNVIKGDLQSIGGHQIEGFTEFTTHEVELKKGDSFYISSDGYQDQFGGPGGKKFLTRQLQTLLVDNQDLSMEEQGELLDKTMKAWKADFKQIDDILVIGVRV